MTPGESKKLVIVAGGGMVVITTLSSLGQGKGLPSPRVPVGAFISTVMLAALAEFAPQVAGALAATALITTAFVYGGPAWSALAAYSSGAPKK